MAEKSRAVSEPVLIWFGQQGDNTGPADEMPAALHFTRDRTHLPAFLAGSLALHICVLALFVLTERAPQLKPKMQQEIPVELVTDPGKDAGGPGKDKAKTSGGPAEVKAGAAGKPAMLKPASAPKPEASKAAAPKAASASATPKVETPKVEAAKPEAIKLAAPKPSAPPKPPAPKPLAEKPPPPAAPKPDVKPVPQPEAQKPPQPAPKPVTPPPAPKPPPPPPPEATKPPPQVVPKPPPQPALAPTPAPAASPPPAAPVIKPLPAPTGPDGTPEGEPKGLMQDNSPAVAVPQSSDDGGDIVSYQTLVLGMLELKKDFPADALRRGAFGTAQIYFELNDDGSVKTERLLKSSGDASLDIESLALVQRVAPFPKPPAGAEKVYAVDIVFPPPPK